ncbi:hypothetical protein ABIA00_004532 [Bradyrhizobium ottawaense]
MGFAKTGSSGALPQMREEWNSSPPSKLRDSLIEVGRLPAVGPNPAAGFL